MLKYYTAIFWWVESAIDHVFNMSRTFGLASHLLNTYIVASSLLSTSILASLGQAASALDTTSYIGYVAVRCDGL